jgi:hypothetical protein
MISHDYFFTVYQLIWPILTRAPPKRRDAPPLCFLVAIIAAYILINAKVYLLRILKGAWQKWDNYGLNDIKSAGLVKYIILAGAGEGY